MFNDGDEMDVVEFLALLPLTMGFVAILLLLEDGFTEPCGDDVPKFPGVGLDELINSPPKLADKKEVFAEGDIGKSTN